MTSEATKLAKALTDEDIAFLKRIAAGKIGMHRKYGFRGRAQWEPHYINGLVTYPGASYAHFVPVELTELGIAVMALAPSDVREGNSG